MLVSRSVIAWNGATHLPVPWLDGALSCDAADLDGIVEFVTNHPAAAENSDLVEALTRSAARAAIMAGPLGAPAHILCAQFMLEMAVERRMPAVERWAVAWLSAAGGTQLRLRWSSRARDGRFRREMGTAAPIVSIAATADRAVLGLASGAVESWTQDGELRSLLPGTGSPVWALAARDGWIVAAGPRNRCVTRGWSPSPPPLPLPSRGQKIVAISPSGDILLGDEQGRLLTWASGGEWAALPAAVHVQAQGKVAVAVAFADGPPRAVRAAWPSGEIAEFDLIAGSGDWRPLHHVGVGVRVAAWSRGGDMLAVAIGREVRLISPGRDGPAVVRPLWTQDGVQSLAWSATGILASASLDQIRASTAPVSV